MSKELNNLQQITFYSLIIFLFFRGSGFNWLISLFVEKGSSFATFLNFIDNDKYATFIVITLLSLLFLFGKNDGMMKKTLTKIFGKKKDV